VAVAIAVAQSIVLCAFDRLFKVKSGPVPRDEARALGTTAIISRRRREPLID